MYKLVFGLVGRTTCNRHSMPPHISDESLADKFSLFFMDKILTNRKTLEKKKKLAGEWFKLPLKNCRKVRFKPVYEISRIK